MKSSIRFLVLASLPAAALSLGCSNSKPQQTYTADNRPAPQAPVATSTTAPTQAQRPAGWSAPVWRGPVPSGSTTSPSMTGPGIATTPPPPATMNAPPPAMPTPSYGFNWSSSLRQAQESARAQGKLIFLEAGRKACTNCMLLKNEIIPSASVNGELGSMSVGYYDDVDLTPYSEAFNLLQANVTGAGTLPLCGWVTADLRWVHGFWGRRDASKFIAEIGTARSTYQRMAAAARPATSVELGRLPSIGSLPDAELADVTAELLDDKMIDTSTGIPNAMPVEQAGAAPVLAATEPVEAPAPEPALPTEVASVPETNVPPVFASMNPRLMPTIPTSIPVAAPATSTENSSREFVRDELKRAAAALAARQYTEARSILSDVKARAAGMPESREADKGEVAIYNLRKLEKARVSVDADKIRATAQRDLKDTIWMSLFA